MLIVNELLIIAYLVYGHLSGFRSDIDVADVIMLVLMFVITLDAVYISSMNLKNSGVLTRFTWLLILSGWYTLLSIDSGDEQFAQLLSFCGSVLLYAVYRFISAFLFQDAAYLYKKQADILLKGACVFTVFLGLIQDSWFHLFYLFQLVLSFGVGIGLCYVHRKRILFVLRNEWKQFGVPALTAALIFFGYVLYFGTNPEFVEGLGIYPFLFLPLLSIHRIALTHAEDLPVMLFRGKSMLILMVGIISLFSLITLLLRLKPSEFFVILHGMLLCMQAYTLLLYVFAKNQSDSACDSSMQNIDSHYAQTLLQIKREEAIQRDFSHYLHDGILQDLLSIRNMMNKSDRTEIRGLIMEALDRLNLSIRQQMQEYQPALLNTLTLKENLRNLLSMVQQTYPTRRFAISFECDDTFFLVEPYNYMMYRMLKELAANAFKHSGGTTLDIRLSLNFEQVKLWVQDNGIGLKNFEHAGEGLPKGLQSIREQLALINGSITLEEARGGGLCVTVKFLMKGEGSYAHYLDR
ncbi:sensor histidine kinase [Paenibacillus alvei]|uniref:sensor histidine kinase n=1 Tax=Paenibacillus alvei TaxID=44250 RepID=UPI0022808817|nr:ATP-binding protein [Paenibacillus alvei]